MKNKPIWNKKQVEKVKKYLSSEKGKKDMKKFSESIKSNDIFSDMEFSWEEWNKIKDIPYTI